MAMRGRPRVPCKFYGTARGCRNGVSCTFLHDVSAPSPATAGLRRSHVTRSYNGPASARSGSVGDAAELASLLQQVADSLEPDPSKCQQWLQLAFHHLSRGSGSIILSSLRQDDGTSFMTSVALQSGLQAEHLLGVLVPLLKLLTAPNMDHPTYTNPILAVIHSALDLRAIAGQLAELSQDPAAAGPGFLRSKAGVKGMPFQCVPTDWLDVLHPLSMYMRTAILRFSGDFMQQPHRLASAQELHKVLLAATQSLLPANGHVAESAKAPGWRRLLADLALLERQLNAQCGKSDALDHLLKMQKQHKEQVRRHTTTSTGDGPGILRPAGPRHDNDKENHLEISVHPTRDEVLCKVPPFLPTNRPGGVNHASYDPDRAHREVHFRLLRQDLLAPISTAAQAFLQFGGVAGLSKLKGSTPGSSARLRLPSGRDYQDLYVFRNVAILGLTSTFVTGNTGSIAYRIEFDDVPQLKNATHQRRSEWWRHTKQLQHGSLICLWWDGDGGPSAPPNLMFATVCERDEKLLASIVEARMRPQLGIRMCGPAVTSDLMAAVLGRQQLGGKKEVVLLPAAGGFFAYEPILKALQSAHPLPLARYILQHPTATAGNSRVALGQPMLIHGDLVGGTAQVQVPAYIAGPNSRYDLSLLISQENLEKLSAAQIASLQQMPISQEDGVPLGLLGQASSLDASQAKALTACLTQELALIQGPPGTGKTFIGIKLVQLLLANTRNEEQQDMTGPATSSQEQTSTVPVLQRPHIGPILILCFTNHALDSFLEGLVDAGISQGIIRVGGRSKSTRLEKYNLRNQEDAKARGPEVGKCRAAVEDLKQLVNTTLEKVRTSRQARRLRWDDIEEWLLRLHSPLHEAFVLRAELMQEARLMQVAGTNMDGFMVVRGRGKKHQSGKPAGSSWGSNEWIWGDDPLQDWLHSHPTADWQRQQWLQEAQRHWQQQASEIIDGPGSSNSSFGIHTGPRSFSNTSKVTETSAMQQNSTYTISSNPFDTLNSLGDDATEQEILAWAVLQAESMPGPHPQHPADIADTGSSTEGASGSMQDISNSLLPMGGLLGGMSWLQLDCAAGDSAESAEANCGWKLDDGAATDSTDVPEAPQHQRGGQQQQQDCTTHTGQAENVLTGQPAHPQELAVPPAVVHQEGLDRPVEELMLVTDITAMSSKERNRLYQHWLDTKASDWGREINDLVQDLEDQQRTLGQLYDDASLQVLRGARIIGMTTTGLANKQGLLHALQPKVVIVEEAAEVLEAHILTSLAASVEHLVLIGDHLQLPPKVQVYELQQESGKGHDLNMSMFERMITHTNVKHVMLEEQRRMRPDIAELIRSPLYPTMRDHLAVSSYPPVQGMVHNLYFWDHDHKEGGQEESRSKFNTHEVEGCVGLARYLLQQGYVGEGEVTILTPYVGQLMKLKQAFEAVAGLRFVMSDRDQLDLENALADAAVESENIDGATSSIRWARADGASILGCGSGSTSSSGGSSVVTLGQAIRLATIDNFQGEEARIVIISLVRNPKEEGAGIGFLASNSRINVLLSRAKEGMYLLGSSAALHAAADKAAASGRSCMWSSVLERLESHGMLGKQLQVCCQRHKLATDILRPSDFEHLVGDGGCQQECGRKLPQCGHVCPRRCHADDPRHTQSKCIKQCSRLCARSRHPCQRLCYEKCTMCEAIEESVELPCGHTAKNVPCFQAADPSKIECKEPCSVTMPGCHHTLMVHCNQRSSYLSHKMSCTKLVQLYMPACGHTLQLPCGKAAVAALDSTLCTQKCGGLIGGCEHTCTGTCGDCLRVRLDVAVTKPVLHRSSTSAGSGGTATETEEGIVKLFLQHLQVSSGAGNTLYRVWADWSEDIRAGASTALRKQSIRQRWQRFTQDKLLPALGGVHCAVVTTIVSAAATEHQQLPGIQAWERWFYLSGQEFPGQDNTSSRLFYQLAVEWQRWLVATSLSDSNSSTADALPPSSQQQASLAALKRLHTPCKQICNKPLACGHSCRDHCHVGRNCGSCQQSCDVRCQHSSCHLRCADPCAPCAELCSWTCEHKGPCLLPCGVPCDRQPCNHRCNHSLPCGHRCPGLCGEPCLPQDCCVHPQCRSQTPADILCQVVDLIMYSSFSSLTDDNVTADPLIMLPCKHVFTTSTLDGHLDMASAYHALDSTCSGTNLTTWVKPVNRDDFPVPKGCPQCRRLIVGVRRYGRIVLHSQLGLTQRKHVELVSGCQAALQELSKLQTLLSNTPALPGGCRSDLDHAMDQCHDLRPLLLSQIEPPFTAACNLGMRFNQLRAQAERTPKHRVSEALRAALLTAVQQKRLHPIEFKQRRADLEYVTANTSRQLILEATAGRGGAMQLCVKFTGQALEVLAEGVSAIAMRKQELSERRHINRRLDKWVDEQGRQLSTQVRCMTVQARNMFNDSSKLLRLAIRDAAAGSDYTGAYQLSYSLMSLLVERAAQLQPLKLYSLAHILAPTLSAAPTDRDSGADSTTGIQGFQQHLSQSQKKLLQEAKDVADAALQLFAKQQQQLLASAVDTRAMSFVDNLRYDSLDSVKALLQKLPGMESTLMCDSDPAEIAAVLKAVAEGMGHYYSRDLQSFMAGHLYQCPNGHLFVIGECGGAMQTSRCDRCGEVIGGTGHRLHSSNRHAAGELVGAVAAAARAQRAGAS